MPKLDYQFSSFVAGVLSPSIIAGRVDLERYYDGLETCENFLVRPVTGATRRPGTQFIESTKFATQKARLIPFQFSIVNNHMLEFGDRYIRFYQEGAQITDGGGAPIEAVSPYTEAMLDAIRFTQSADILYLTHQQVDPQQLQRLSATNWQLVVTQPDDGPFQDINTDSANTLNAAMGPIGLIASGVFATADVLEPSTDIGRLIRASTRGAGATWGTVRITAIADPRNFTYEVVVAATGGDFDAMTAWRLGAWSVTTGFPATVGIVESRIWYGATTDQPQTIWSSKTNKFDNFAPSDLDGTVTDDAGITRTLDSDRVNTLRWIDGNASGVIVGGEGAEFLIAPGITSDVLTPSNAVDRPHTVRGSHPTARQLKLDHVILFIEAGGEFLSLFQFSFERNAFVITPLTTLVDHLAEHRFVQLAIQDRPYRVIWALTEDGRLYAVTFETDQRILAWHTHVLGGTFEGGDPVVESIAQLFNGTDDELWLIVKRTINGATVRHIERLTPTFRELDDQEDALYLDASLTFDSTPATVFTGLDHLESETIQIIADGEVRDDETVSGGSVTLDDAASVVHFGFHRFSELTPVSAELPINRGGSLGMTKRIARAFVNFRRTKGASIKRADGTFEPIPFRETEDAMDTAVPLFSGVKRLTPDRGFEEFAQTTIRCETALPCTILGMRFKMELNDA